MDKDQLAALNSLQEPDQEEWGGSGIRMSVRTNGVTIEFDCAEAEITETFSTTDGSSFSLAGMFLRHAPGAMKEDFKPKPVSAHFEGKILDDEMSLRISDWENGELIGIFALKRESPGRIHRCL